MSGSWTDRSRSGVVVAGPDPNLHTYIQRQRGTARRSEAGGHARGAARAGRESPHRPCSTLLVLTEYEESKQ